MGGDCWGMECADFSSLNDVYRHASASPQQLYVNATHAAVALSPADPERTSLRFGVGAEIKTYASRGLHRFRSLGALKVR
jgi:hypothetical protein